MDSITHSLNYELPHELQLNKYAQQILDTSEVSEAQAMPLIAATPTITTFDALANSDFLQKVGASILNSIQLNQMQKLDTSSTVADKTIAATTTNDLLHSTVGNSVMDISYTPNHVIIDSSSFDGMDDLQKQLEYDRFMNEIWIGIVFTLILISMIFCICSCFLYHQFRTWKRNYNNGANNTDCSIDIETVKLQGDLDDPVPEYTLVSGLPTYEAALELLHKTPQSCLLVYPSVFNLFNKHEKAFMEQPAMSAPAAIAAATATKITKDEEQQQQLSELTMPLLMASTAAQTIQTPTATIVHMPTMAPTHTPETTATTTATTATAAMQESIKSNFATIPSYAEAVMSFQTIDERTKDKRTMAEATTTTLQRVETFDSLTHNKSESDKS